MSDNAPRPTPAAASLRPEDLARWPVEATAAGGVSPEALRAFLAEVQAAWAASLADAERLRAELRTLDATVDALRAERDEVHHTLALARRMAAELGADARREADVVLGEARLEAEHILATAQDARDRLEADIARLQDDRTQHLTQMRALLDAHARLLDAVEART